MIDPSKERKILNKNIKNLNTRVAALRKKYSKVAKKNVSKKQPR